MDSIASGPTYLDNTTCKQALDIIRKYGLRLEPHIIKLLGEETPKNLSNVETIAIGCVRIMCEEATKVALEQRYKATIKPPAFPESKFISEVEV